MRPEELIINTNNFILAKLIGINWKSNGLASPFMVLNDAGTLLTTILTKIEPEKPLIIDCKHVINEVDRSLESFFSAIHNTNRPVIFVNHDGLAPKIDTYTSEFCNGLEYRKPPNSNVIIIGSPPGTIQFEKLESKISDLVASEVKNYIARSFIKNENDEFALLPSTPMQSNGVFNAGIIIANPKWFYWTCIALFELLVTKLSETGFNTLGSQKKVKLLSVSLRASPFASVVSFLSGFPLEIIDQLGPKHKIFDIHTLEDIQSETNTEYLYFGDYTAGGTEIKIAKTYASVSGAGLSKAFVLGSLHHPKVFIDYFDLYPLARLKQLGCGVEYRFFDIGE